MELKTKSGLLKAWDRPFRLEQLQKLIALYEDNISTLIECLQSDYGMGSYAHHIRSLISEVKECIRNFHITNTKRTSGHWMSKQIVTEKHEAAGLVLIVSDSNYPLPLCLLSLPAAIAAGNMVVIKPSLCTPEFNKKMEYLMSQCLDQDCYRIVLDLSVPDVLACRFDHILCMGNAKFVRVVYGAAQEQLVPVTIVTNGKNPVYVDDTCCIEDATRQIIHAKMSSLSQPCKSPDYIMCTEPVRNKIVDEATRILGQSDTFVRIASEDNFRQLKRLLGDTKGHVIGGQFDEGQRMSLTIVTGVTKDDPLWTEEFVGPLLPVITVANAYDAISFVRNKQCMGTFWPDHTLKPLAFYAFTTKRLTQMRLMDGIVAQRIFFNTIQAIDCDTEAARGLITSGQNAFDMFSRSKVVYRCVPEPLPSLEHDKSNTNNRKWQILPANIPVAFNLKIVAVALLVLFLAQMFG